MKSLIFRLVTCVSIALAALAAAGTTPAAASTGSTITITYCWSKTTFGPRGCNSAWPTSSVPMTGGATSGTVPYGTYLFSNNQNDIRIVFTPPTVGVNSVVYTGARYPGGAPNCYRGTMIADRVVNPDPTGVWFGCVQ